MIRRVALMLCMAALTGCLVATARAADERPAPVIPGPVLPAAYADNTLICLGRAGADRCHLWLDEAGLYVLQGGGLPRQGRWRFRGAGLCLEPPAAPPALPAGFAAFAGDPPPGGLCLSLAAHVPGDRWTEAGQRLLMLAGHQ